MTNVIVTTTINYPTEAIDLFDDISSLELIVIGKNKTLVDYKLRRGLYVTPEKQAKRDPRLSKLPACNCIQRRNIGFLTALDLNASIVATVDDDKIPDPSWGRDLLTGQSRPVLTRDFSLEVIGYERTLALLGSLRQDPDNLFAYLPGSAVAAFLEYQAIARKLIARRLDS